MPRSPGAPRRPADCPPSWCSRSTRRNRYERQGILAEPAAIEQAVASVRHVDTDYDALLMSGVDRESARAQVHQRVEEIVNAWRDGVVMLDG
jgi:hypothetical protein